MKNKGLIGFITILLGFLFVAKKTMACGLLCWVIGAAIVSNSVNSSTEETKKNIDKKTRESISYEACNKYGGYLSYINEIGKCVLKFDKKGRAVYSDGTSGYTYGCSNYEFWRDIEKEYYYNCPIQ